MAARRRADRFRLGLMSDTLSLDRSVSRTPLIFYGIGTMVD